MLRKGFCGLTSQFENLCSQVLHDSGHVDGSFRAYPDVLLSSIPEETVGRGGMHSLVTD